MGENEMPPPRPSRLLTWCFGLFLMVAVPGVGIHQAWGQEGVKVILDSGQDVEAQTLEKTETEKPSLTMEPFYLIEETASSVRVRQVTLALEFSRPEMMKQVDPLAPRLRELVYDFLVAKEHDYPDLEKKEQQKALTGLVNRYLGQEALTAVKVDQSFLLLR